MYLALRVPRMLPRPTKVIKDKTKYDRKKVKNDDY
jgi:hypothetical protein